ncbi:PilZ domain-containing protein [Marinobacteraceae bacterium S3BR75-40.1]
MSQSDEQFEQWIPSEDQRQEYRLTGRVWVYVEVEAPDPISGADGRSLRCWSNDISANGLRLQAPEPLPQGALLPVCVEIAADQAYFLMGEVMWCRPSEDSEGQFTAGFALHESDRTSILEWKEAIAQLLAGD